jgi:hypothetical protein
MLQGPPSPFHCFPVLSHQANSNSQISQIMPLKDAAYVESWRAALELLKLSSV